MADTPVLASVELNLEQLRLLSKSVSRSIDAEVRKLTRLKADTPVHREVKAAYQTLDGIKQELDDAIYNLIGA